MHTRTILGLLEVPKGQGKGRMHAHLDGMSMAGRQAGAKEVREQTYVHEAIGYNEGEIHPPFSIPSHSLSRTFFFTFTYFPFAHFAHPHVSKNEASSVK